MKRFKDQSAIITGGAEGLGKGIAERIASEGGKIFLFDVNRSMLERTIKDFKNKGYDAEGFAVDVSSESSVVDGIRQVEEKAGQVHIMVNAAGIVGLSNTKITDYPVDDYDNIYRVNLRGSFLMTKYAIKAMEKYNYGRILLIASIAGKEGNPFMTGYSSMKAGVIGLVKGIGKEYAQTGITINGLAPAVIKTAMNEKTAPEQLAYMTAKIPMARLGTVEELSLIHI